MSTVRIQLRRGLAEDWADVDPVLAAGEVGIESDTNKFKIGNNSDSWTELAYANVTPTGLGDSLSDYVLIADVGQANGVAALDSDGLVPTNQLPPLVKISVNTVADQTARLNLTAQPGDIAIQSDNETTYVLSASPATTNANWKEIVAKKSAAEVATSQIETHNLDTTNVHGITDTSLLVTTDGNQTLTNKTINSSNNTVTITTSNVSDYTETTQDLMNSTIIGGTNIDTSYNDNAGTLTVNLSDNVTITGDFAADEIGAASIIVTGEIQAGSLTVDGDLTVNGTYNAVPVESLTVTNPMIYMADGNIGNSVDIGIVGSHTISGTYSHTGFVKDATDGVWKLFSGVTNEPTTTIDFSTYTKGTMQLGVLYADEIHVGDVSNTEFQYLNGVTSAIQTQIDNKLSLTDASSNYAVKNNTTLTGTVTLPGTTSIGDVSATEIGYLNGVTSNVQTQIDGKTDTGHTHTVSNITDITASANEINILDGVTASTSEINILDGVTASTSEINILNGATLSTTELNYVDGVTSNIQTQIDAKASTTSLSDHTSDTTNVHGIADTSLLVTTSDLSSAITGHETDTTTHGTTGHIVGTSDTQTLTNKTISYLNNTITVQTANISDITASASELNILDGVTASSSEINTLDGITASTSELNILDGATLSTTELNYVDGVTSAIQTQIDNKQDKISGVSDTEIGYLDGVTSSIQTQLNSKAPLASPTFTGTATTSDLVVNGDFTVNGTNFAASATSITIEDNMVQLAHQNSANTVDLGIVVAYNDGAAKHAGIVRDVSADKWKLFKGVTDEPSTTVNFGQGSLDSLAVAALEATTITPSSGIVFSDGTQTKEGVPSRTPIVQKTAGFNITDADYRDSMIEVDHTGGSAVTVTVTADGTNGITYPVGTSIDILRTNTGSVTVSGSGATVNYTPGATLRARWSSATLFKRAANTWVLLGDLSA